MEMLCLRSLWIGFAACLAFFSHEIWAQTSRVEPLSRIVFASCCHQSKPAPIFDAIVRYRPQLFVWMGDVIYGDSANVAVLREKYQLQQFRPSYRSLCELCPVIGTWDDHDYGANDAGREYPMKAESQAAFLDFLQEPVPSKRRQQQGIYATYVYGPVGQQIRLILLDTRYFRDQVGSDGALLGEAQWQWFERTLQHSKAQIHVVVSSIQVVAEEHRFEKWASFPKERLRLLRMLAQPKMPPVVILSGDRHLAEISQAPAEWVGYPLYEITSSALKQSRGSNNKEVNRYRVGKNYGYNNFGSLNIDWSRKPPVITGLIHDADGAVVRSHPIPLPARMNQIEKIQTSE
jgi:alkaline phosphatase D